ncbi:hypothetical protein HC031_32055 [Planosporangium thailandense]|uniref:ABM domain-containing protein n=1 Tax=Planosporangium thailandense TaxID=765197 RepID=A0ABX0Y789_9ACTN|nr:hypothetical protein [Planosporangium thailandense]NJC74311.1 hypothetical protein [Planosporangium thailandense]
MAVIRTTRFTVDPVDVETMLARRGQLLAAVRAAFAGPTEARLVRLDEETWLDIWRWDSGEALRAALEGAPGLPEAGAAFAVTRDASVEQGDVVDEDVWAR